MRTMPQVRVFIKSDIGSALYISKKARRTISDAPTRIDIPTNMTTNFVSKDVILLDFSGKNKSIIKTEQASKSKKISGKAVNKSA
tara:strand:- start:196 stop:450 length:255 start_codon:yes stop_codon:yes gene_type:complete